MDNEQKNTIKKRGKYNEGILDALVEILSRGISINAACGYVGISRGSFYKWKSEHPEFENAINGSKFQLEARLLTQIEDQGGADWRALAWILERRYPQDWSLKRELEVSINKSNGTNEVIEFLKQSKEIGGEDESSD
jgi:hypothetical protein